MKERIQIEETFFKINFYFGGTLENEIEKVIPQLIEKHKDKDDDDDMMMEGMEDMVGMVSLTRTSTRSTCASGRTHSRSTKTPSSSRSRRASWVGAGREITEDQEKYVDLLQKTIQINKNLLPQIQKRKLDKTIQMRIMTRVKSLKDELKMIEDVGNPGSGDENPETDL